MWFSCALLTTLMWAFADLFYKKGSDSKDENSHLKIVVMVGLVMGIHGIIYMIYNKILFNPIEMVRYFPVSILYILSMTIGYFGLRYIELSISSPIQNSSGAVTALLCFIFFGTTLSGLEISGIMLITLGILGVFIIERIIAEKNDLKNVNSKYKIGFVAIIFPLLYCLIDGLGTFADAIYLDEMELITEDNALLAYEFTFLACGILSFLYLKFVKKDRMKLIDQKNRGFAAIFETLGQFFYVYAMSGKAIIAAPLIASYAIFSVLLSRIFLKEKLTKLQYVMIFVVVAGILLLGISEGLAE